MAATVTETTTNETNNQDVAFGCVASRRSLSSRGGPEVVVESSSETSTHPIDWNPRMLVHESKSATDARLSG